MGQRLASDKGLGQGPAQKWLEPDVTTQGWLVSWAISEAIDGKEEGNG